MVAVAQRNHLCPHGSGRPRPGGEADHRCDHEWAAPILSDAERNQDQQHKRGNDDEQVGDELDDVVHHPAHIARHQAEDEADQGGNQPRHQADLKRDARGRDQLRHHISAEVVGAERQQPHVRHLTDVDVVRLPDGARLCQGGRVSLPRCDDGLLGRQEAGNGAVQPDEIIAPGVGHPWDVLLGIVVASPLREESRGIGRIDLGLGNSGLDEPFFHGQTVGLTQPAGHALGGCVVEEERVLRGGIDAVVGVHVDARRKERALSDDLQRRMGDDQGVDDHDQQHGHEDDKARHELPGAKDLSEGMLHRHLSLINPPGLL